MGLTNFIINPSFEAGIGGWTTGTGNVLDRHAGSNTGEKVVGDWNAQVVYGGIHPTVLYTQLNGLPANTAYAFSAYVYILRSSVITETEVVLFGDVSDSTTSQNEWVRLEGQVWVGEASVAEASIHLTTASSGDVIYVDAIQFERIGSYSVVGGVVLDSPGVTVTDYFDGDMDGVEWDGESHFSTSTKRISNQDGVYFLLEDDTAGTLYNIALGHDLIPILGTLQTTQSDGLYTTTVLLYYRGSATELRDVYGRLETILIQAVRWHNSMHETQAVWLRFHTADEKEKRALVYSYEMEIDTSGGTGVILRDYGLMGEHHLVHLAVTHGIWESRQPVSLSLSYNHPAGGLRYWCDLTDEAHGKMPGRIGFALMTSYASVNFLQRAWIGIRNKNFGSTSFDPVLENENLATNQDAALVSPSGASPSGGSNNAVHIQFSSGGGTNSMSVRFTLRLQNHAATEEARLAHIGNYYLLWRYQVVGTADIGAKVGVDMGELTTENTVFNEEVYLSGTGGHWRYVNMGTISIPNRSYRHAIANYNSLANYTIRLFASRYSGSGTLYGDAFVLMPTDHFVFVDNMWADDNFYPRLHTFENGEVLFETHQFPGSPSLVAAPPVNAQNWNFPEGGGILVVASECDDRVNLGDIVLPNSIEIYPRWRSYRDD